MNILFVITGLGMGGAETQVIGLADYFASLGHRVLVLSLRDEPVVLPLNDEVAVLSLGMEATPNHFFAAYVQARRALREFKPDVVHAHMVHANIFARLLRLTTPIPRLICSSHSSYEGGRLRTWAYRVTDWLSDVNTNVSNNAVRSAVRAGQVRPNKMITVYNGIDCERFQRNDIAREEVRDQLSATPETKVLLAVGRFAEAKDYPNLFAALARVIGTRHDAVLWIAGAGDAQGRYQALAAELGIARHVTFLGLRRDIPELINGADVFVLSSAWEGFGLAVAEAMACERIVVATDCGGVREVLGDTGMLVPPKDSDALATALTRALGLTGSALKGFGRAGRERVLSNYSMKSAAAKWLQIYQGEISGIAPGMVSRHIR